MKPLAFLTCGLMEVSGITNPVDYLWSIFLIARKYYKETDPQGNYSVFLLFINVHNQQNRHHNIF